MTSAMMGDDENVSFSLTKSFMFLCSFVLPQNVSFENVSFNVSFVICHSSFVIRHSSFVIHFQKKKIKKKIRHSSFVIRHSSFIFKKIKN